jgi:hypothetical protein
MGLGQQLGYSISPENLKNQFVRVTGYPEFANKLNLGGHTVDFIKGLFGKQESDPQVSTLPSDTQPQPEQQAKQVAQVAQVKAQAPSATVSKGLGSLPEEKKNTLQKLGMLFKGLGATTAAFDEGMRSKFIADRPGQQLTEELLKDEELRNQRMKEKRDEMYKRAVLSQKTNTGGAKMTELAAKVMMDSMNPQDQKAWIEANTKGGFLGIGQTVPTTNDYYNAKLQMLKPTLQSLMSMGGTAGSASTDDIQAIEWAKANMSDPRAQQILQLHGLM